MNWIVGRSYIRRNKGRAEYRGPCHSMPVFFHADLVIPESHYDGNSMHRWDGTMMSLRENRESCAPYDIITDESDTQPVLKTSAAIEVTS